MVGFPLLLIPVAIYNMIVFLMPGVTMVEPIARLPLMSGAEWQLTLSDMMLALGIVLLMFEVIKGARPGAKYLTDHLLSLLVFAGAAVEFLELPRFGTSTYFLLALLALVDFLSGLALRSRRVTKVVEPAVAQTVAASAGGASPEPQFDPAPASLRLPAPPADAPPPPPALQAAASVAEAVLLDRPEPKFSQAAETGPTSASPQVASPQATSPQVTSPGLQPGEGLLPSAGASR
jgi:hypothetical protein